MTGLTVNSERTSQEDYCPILIKEVKKGKVCLRAKWPIRLELIPVSLA